MEINLNDCSSRKNGMIVIPAVVCMASSLRRNCEALTESIEKIKDTEVILSTFEYESGNSKT